MKNVIGALALALLTGPVLAAEAPDWAYPITPKPEPKDNVVLKQMPGSSSNTHMRKSTTASTLRTGFPTSIR